MFGYSGEFRIKVVVFINFRSFIKVNFLGFVIFGSCLRFLIERLFINDWNFLIVVNNFVFFDMGDNFNFKFLIIIIVRLIFLIILCWLNLDLILVM